MAFKDYTCSWSGYVLDCFILRAHYLEIVFVLCNSPDTSNLVNDSNEEVLMVHEFDHLRTPKNENELRSEVMVHDDLEE